MPSSSSILRFAASFALLACGPSTDPPPPADGGVPPADAPRADAPGTDANVAPDPTLVETNNGPVRGVADGDLRIFRGIPYAAPPIGSLRFRPPATPARFETPFDASTFGPVCPQFARENLVTPTDTVEGDEACLTLNVWTHIEGAARPVMLFIHGGGFQQGAGSLDTYEGSSLARAGGVVIVTINYRLGSLGLLATEALATESGEDSAGNYTTRDQIAALEWVRDNVAAFGGDPANVTIFGESAGGVSVCTLLASPMADGLFERGIVQSGGGCYGLPHLRTPGPTGRLSAMARSAEIVTAAGCDGAADELACLRALPAEALVRAGAEGTMSGLGLPDFSPNIEGTVLTVDAFDAFRDGDRDVPLIIGSNADEATIFTIGTPILTVAAYERAARTILGAVADDVLLLYPASDYPTPKAAFNQAYGEIAFVCPALAMAQAAGGGTEPAWSYRVTRAPTGTYAWLGAFHGIELFFVFGNFPPDIYTPTAADLSLQAEVQAAWTSFARDGAPVTSPAWPPYTTAEPAFAIFDQPISVAPEIAGGRCAELARLGLVPTP